MKRLTLLAVVAAAGSALTPLACLRSSSAGAIAPAFGRLTADEQAGLAFLVKDIRSSAAPRVTSGGSWSRFLTIGSTTFFTASTAENGIELWKTDGTLAGTVLVKDIYPGPIACGVNSPVDFGGILVFVADDGATGVELWRSDGTTAGTYMVRQIQAGPDIGTTNPSIDNLTVCGSQLFFAANDHVHGAELWSSDGTSAGTGMVKDIQPGANGSSPLELTCINGIVYFQANDGTTGTELWRSDGTSSGTYEVLDIYPGSTQSFPTTLTAVGSTLFFGATDATHGTELWKSDGTAAGTVLVADIHPGSASSQVVFGVAVNNLFVFTEGASTYPFNYALYRSDGTAAGTYAIGSGFPDSSGYFSEAMMNGFLYYMGDNASSDEELWRTDGSAAGTTEVANLNPSGSSYPESFVVIGSTLFFGAGDGSGSVYLYKSDGTTAGTVKVSGAPILGSFINADAALGNQLVFSAPVSSTSNQLYLTDGTTTQLVSNIDPQVSSSYPTALGDLSGTLLFEANDGVNGISAWRSDGTTSGTTLVKTLSATATDTVFATLNGAAFFPDQSSFSSSVLWKSDGTTSGTSQVDTISSATGIAVMNDAEGVLLLTTNSGGIYKSNGTTSGTGILSSSSKVPTKFLTVGSRAVAPLNDFSSPGIWGSDLTTAGSGSLSDSGGTLLTLNYGDAAVLGSWACFVATGTAGFGLYRTDGTSANSTEVVALTQGPGVGAGTHPRTPMASANGLVFFSAYSTAGGYELWKSDGTAAGTVEVKDIAAGSASSGPLALTPMNNELYFIADDGITGYELWKSDGTSAGTVQVADISPGATSAFTRLSTLLAVPSQGLLFFAATDGTHGVELWRSDGTSAGTSMVGDIAPGSDNSNPSSLAVSGNYIFFSANDGVTGREVWAAPLLGPTITCPANVTAEATSSAGATVTFDSAVTVGGTGTVTVAYSQDSGTTFALGATTVTATATDSAGVSSICSLVVTVQDTTPPVITCPASVVADAMEGGTPVTYPPATATDAVSTPAITYSQASGTDFPFGVTTVTATATDAASNASSCTFTVTVADISPPTITCPSDVTAEATSSAGAVVSYPAATATDAYGPATITYSQDSGTTFALGTTQVTATATNAGGLQATCTFNVIVQDTTPPMLSCPMALNVQATSSDGAVVSFDSVSATDAVSTPIVVESPAAGQFPLGSTPVTVTATDAASNQSQCSFTVTVADFAGPSVTCPTDLTAEATSGAGATVDYDDATATDAVTTPVVQYSQDSGTVFPLGMTTVTVQATASGVTASCSFTITVQDTTPPTISCPGDETVEVTSPAGAIAVYPDATASDAVSTPTIAYSRASGTDFPLGPTVVTATATDAAANAASCSFTVTVADLLQPSIACPADVVTEATSSAGAAVTYAGATASDPAGSPAITYSQASGTTFALGTTLVTATATNLGNLTASCSFQVTVADTTPPVVTCPSDVTEEATSSAGAVVDYAPATATDAVTPMPAITYSQDVGTDFSVGVTQVTATATDGAGNSSTCTFNVTVVDTTPPVITCPANVRAAMTSVSGAVVAWPDATATDAVTAMPSITYSPASGAQYPLGVTTVTATATDDAGNASSCTFTVTVYEATSPSITCPTDESTEATSAAGAIVGYPAATASDAFGSPTVTYSQASGTDFPLGMTLVTVTATNLGGLQATCTFTITVADTTPPVVTCPGSLTVQATSAQGAVVTYPDATATDAVSTPSIAYSQASGTDFAVGSTTVTVTATDAAGNSSTCTFLVTTTDLAAPSLSCPMDQVAEATSSAGATVDYPAPVASDPIAPPVLTESVSPGSVFPIGVTDVVVTATNVANLVSTCDFHVTVQDTTPPAITCPDNVTAQASSVSGGIVDYPAATATDAVTASPTIAYSQDSGTSFPFGETTVTTTATDTAGNASACTFIVTVGDLLPPALTCPLDVTAEATSGSGALVSYPPASATDQISAPVVVYSQASGTQFPLGTTPVLVTASNLSNLSSTCSFNVVVVDTTAPVITCPADVSVQATSAAGAIATFSDATASDAVSSPAVTYSQDSGSTFPLGTTRVTATATDAAGNAASCAFHVTVGDLAAPTITCPSDVTAEATSPAGAVVSYPAAIGSDPIAPPAIAYSADSGSTFALGVTTVTATATNVAELSASCSFHVTVQDTTPPVITCPADLSAQATSPSGAIVTYDDATATDAVSTPTITYSQGAGTTFPVATTVVTAMATDAAGNASTCTFQVTVGDLTGPSLTCPSDVVAEATSGAGAIVAYGAATASDPVAPPTVTYSQPSGTTYPLGTTTITVTATNEAAFASTCTFTITVHDTTAPTISCPGNLNVQATSSAGAAVTYAPATASDAVSTPTVTYSMTSGDAFPLGSTTVVVTATDAAGNSSSCSFIVDVGDLTGPSLQCPADVAAEATSAAGAIVNYASAVASDPIAPPVVSYSQAASTTFPLGVTTVTVTATNAGNETSTCTFRVTVRDTTAPTITCPGDLAEQATSSAGATVDYAAAVATDAVSTPVVTYSQDSGTTFPVGTTSVTATATDAAGNSSNCTFDVTVGDLSGPSLACPSDVVAEATSGAGAVVTYSPATATDPLGPPTVTYSRDSGTNFPLGSTTVTVTATNSGDDQSTCTFRVTVHDTTPPTISCPGERLHPGDVIRGSVSHLRAGHSLGRGLHSDPELLAGVRDRVPARRHDGGCDRH